jgi:Family of unknown function (DUF5719)/Peptidase family M23
MPAPDQKARRIFRRASALLVLVLVSASLLAGTAINAPAAGPYTWDGGHDALGASDPAGSAYFAEGTTRNGFEEYLILRNPGAKASEVTIDYLFGSGAPTAQAIRLEPYAGLSICVNDAVGPDKDVSVAIGAEPGIVAERQLYFNYKGTWTGGSSAAGVPLPETSWCFAEGTTRDGFQEWLCLQNPTPRPTAAALTYMLGDGRTIDKSVDLPANSRVTLDVNKEVGAGQDVSVKVTSPEGIIAERPMYFDYKKTWRGGHTATGASTPEPEWHFAEGTTRTGFEEWLCIMNPGEDTTASVEYLFDGGPLQRTYPLKAHSRTTLFVNQEVGPEKDVSINVTSPGEILCERPMYFCYHGAWEGGHDVVGSTAGSRTWYFPTASTGTGFESWLCVANPGKTSNSVDVKIYGDGGDHEAAHVEMAPSSRSTFDLNALTARVRNSWIKVTGTADIIAERPTYFSYTPRGLDEPFKIASWAGTDIYSPIRYADLIGPEFHEAAADGSNCPPMQPYGICLANENAWRMAPGITTGNGNDPDYFIETTRGRGTFSTTACDVHAKAGTTVYAPVNGTVVVAAPYMLYNAYPDFKVLIAIDGHPGYIMECLHMSKLLVATGQRTEAGKTEIGVVRDLVPYFNSGPNPYTREEGNHSHIQINYSR